MSAWANWNGTELPLDDVRVSVLDRAFLFGDGVYEALRVYGRRAWLRDEHLARLRRSLETMRIGCDVDRLARRMHVTLANSGVEDGLIYIQVTRGTAPRTHHFPDPPVAPNELIFVRPFGDPYAEQRRTGARVITQRDERWRRRDIKSVNLLANCFAAQAAHEAGCDEAVLITPDGDVTEGSHTNVFAVNEGRIITSPLGHHILPGITRNLVVRLAARAGIPVAEHPLNTRNLFHVDEVFLTGTTTEVLPVTVVDNHVIGEGHPGPVTLTLQETYRAEVAEWLAEQPGRS